jgi:hypothetical protein
MGLHTLKPYREFKKRVYQHRTELRELIISLVNGGKKVYGYEIAMLD